MDNAIASGWYYAQGDPPGTHRYWDGSSWVGGPQPIATAAPNYGYQQTRGVTDFASWGARFAAYLIDLIITFAVAGGIFGLGGVALANASDDAVFAALMVGIGTFIILTIAYFGGYQGSTGFTVGKKVMSIQLVDMTSGLPPGPGRGIGRYLLAMVLGNLCGLYPFADYLWPLWDDRKQRLTDKIVSTVVANAR